jgi:pre-mRNA-processing factor 19
VRIWQGKDDGSYDCKHILKDHTVEVISSLFGDGWG